MDGEESEFWVKVEYIVDQHRSIVPVEWVKDYDREELWPAFNPHTPYRVFWSDIDDDSPTKMLERAPEVPNLTEGGEKKGRPGFYRANILAVADDLSKLEEGRLRGSTRRQGHGFGQPTVDQHKSKNGKTGNRSPTREKENSKKPQKISVNKKRTRDSIQSHDVNIGRKSEAKSCNAFKQLDLQFGGSDDDDDSEADVTLVSEQEVKVLRSTVKELKAKLREKCLENKSLKDELASKESELKDLRSLNRNYQDSMFDLLRKRSYSNSSSSSSRSLQFSSPVRSLHTSKIEKAAQPLSRASSVSSLSSVNGSSTSSHHVDSDSPVPSPENSAKKLKTHSISSRSPSSCHSSDDVHDSGLSEFTTFDEGTSSGQLSPYPITGSPPLFNLNDARRELEKNSSDTANVNCSNNSNEVSQSSSETRVSDKSANEMVTFINDHKVKKTALEEIEGYSLGKENDSRYVKDLAVAVFSLKVLMNSTATGQQYRKDKSVERRSALDQNLMEEIRARLQARVENEFRNLKRDITAEDRKRFSQSQVNYYVKEKIKRLRNPTSKKVSSSESNTANQD